jgi:hypothetical protein
VVPRLERLWLGNAEGRPEARPLANQAEADPAAGPAAFSTYGQRFRAAIIGSGMFPAFMGAHAAPQIATRGAIGHDAAGNVVREMLPLYRGPWGQKNGYQDLIGAFGARAAYMKPVVAALRYKGQIPMDQQPRLKKAKPWMDPTLGQP